MYFFKTRAASVLYDMIYRNTYTGNEQPPGKTSPLEATMLCFPTCSGSEQPDRLSRLSPAFVCFSSFGYFCSALCIGSICSHELENIQLIQFGSNIAMQLSVQMKLWFLNWLSHSLSAVLPSAVAQPINLLKP